MRTTRAIGTAGLLLLLAVACGGEGPDSESPSAASSAEAPTHLNHDPAVAYLGAEQCRSCHQSIAATHRQTGMGRAFYPLNADTVVEDFSANNEIRIPGTPLHYRMVERDGRYFQQQFVRADAGAAELALDERELLFVVGSNNHSRSYVTKLGERLYQTPVCWYPVPEIWDLCPGYEINNDHFSREISLSCIFCHNGRMELVAGATNRYREPFPHGIGCERCHGPGQLHVEKWRRGDAVPTGQADPTIVNPRRLPQPQRIHVCFQCHLGDSRVTPRVPRTGTTPLDFRPGMPITEFTVPITLDAVARQDFGLTAQGDRLMRSRCFKESDGTLECLTCHNPHFTVYSDDRPADLFRQKCLSCHQEQDCIADASAREQTALADDCVACHMRKAQAHDQQHAEFTDHWIRRSIEDPGRETLELEVVPMFPEQFAGLPPAEQAFYLGRGGLLMSLNFPPGTRERFWVLAEQSLRAALDGGHDGAEGWYYWAKALTFLKRFSEAEQALVRALDREPRHTQAALDLAALRLARGELGGAVTVLDGLLANDPDQAGALAESGHASWLAQRTGDALELFDRAIELEPGNASLRKNRAVALGGLGRFEEASRSLAEATRLDPDSAELWDAYSQVLEQLGRRNEAAEARRILRQLPR